MPVYQYGSTAIYWEFSEEPDLKHHYVTVERGKPLLLRGPAVSDAEKEQLIRNRARWIRDRLRSVNRPLKDAWVTGGRLLYRGRWYYCQVTPALVLDKAVISFNHSRFLIQSPEGDSISQPLLEDTREVFYRQKAKDKLLPRGSSETGLSSTGTG